MEPWTHQLNGEANWHRVRIDEPTLTYGSRLRLLIEGLLAAAAADIKAVVIAGVEGSGDPELGISRLDCGRLTTQEFLERLVSTVQIDWANLFFFVDLSDDTVRDICGELSPVEAIAASVLTVRVIDDSYLDVFTTNVGMALWLTDQYPDAETRFGPLSMMDFPG